MSGLTKLGYFLMGVGVGGFIIKQVYEYELDKPIGEVEEYIPQEDEESESDSEEESDDSENSNKHAIVNDVSSGYVATAKDLFNHDISNTLTDSKMQFDRDKAKTNYSKMYIPRPEASSEKTIEVEVDDTDVDEVVNLDDPRIVIEDYPPEDEVYLEDETMEDDILVRERVEDRFEIYLDENPQDFIGLVYYELDQTLADDRDQIVPDPEDVIGHVAIDRLIEGGPGATEGVIYVRNLKTMLNYEVVLDSGSYQAKVFGLFGHVIDDGADLNGNT